MNKPHQTWSDSPIHEQIRDAGLDPVNRTMYDTPTPDTDEHEFPCMTWPSADHPMVVRSEFARKLERERDEAREALAELRASVLDLSHPNIKMILSERDEAREALRTGGMLNIIDRAHHERAAAIRERDEAREEAAMWKSNHDNQAALKSMLMERPDLGDRASRIAELISERDRLAEALRELCETLLNDKPRDITELLNKAGDALAAVKGGQP